MRYLIIVFVFLFSTTPGFSAWKETGNNLARFVCQEYSYDEPRNLVIIVEQLSVDTVDGSLHIDPDEIEGELGEENRFRMKIYRDSTLISSEKTKEEVIKDLLSQEASLDSDGNRMEYEGMGSRFLFEFTFVSEDESKVFNIDLRNRGADISNNNIIISAFLQCEEPELFPEKILVED